jgi:hypothetical protein
MAEDSRSSYIYRRYIFNFFFVRDFMHVRAANLRPTKITPLLGSCRTKELQLANIPASHTPTSFPMPPNAWLFVLPASDAAPLLIEMGLTSSCCPAVECAGGKSKEWGNTFSVREYKMINPLLLLRALYFARKFIGNSASESSIAIPIHKIESIDKSYPASSTASTMVSTPSQDRILSRNKHTRRRFDPVRRLEVAKTRELGACQDCHRRKVRVRCSCTSPR